MKNFFVLLLFFLFFDLFIKVFLLVMFFIFFVLFEFFKDLIVFLLLLFFLLFIILNKFLFSFCILLDLFDIGWNDVMFKICWKLFWIDVVLGMYDNFLVLFFCFGDFLIVGFWRRFIVFCILCFKNFLVFGSLFCVWFKIFGRGFFLVFGELGLVSLIE